MFDAPQPSASTGSAPKKPALLLATLFCLTLAFATTPAQALDHVGIFWDTDYTQTTLTQDPVPGSATGYLVITDPSVAGGIVGWELCAEKTGGGFIYSWTLAGQAFNLESEPCFSVAVAEPLLPVGNTILLATFQTYLSNGEPASFYLDHIPSPQGGQMSYIPASDTRYPIELTTTTGSGPVARIVTNAPWAIFNTQALDFGVRPINGAVAGNIVVENGGGGDLELDINLSQDCAGFALSGVSGPVTVPAGASLVVPVTFTPLAVQAYSCSVSFGGTLPLVTLDGMGRLANYQYTLYTDRDFGELFVGDTRDMNVVIRNTGYDPIPIVPDLLGCGSDFAIVSGGEPATLDRLEAQSVVVRFQPTTADTFACALSFGPGIDQVGLLGSARASGFYYTAPTEVDFGTREAGLTVGRTVSVRNTGTIGFTVAPALVGCGDDFTITSGSQVATVNPGYTRQIVVQFQPGSEGDFACALALGPLLPEVQLFGHGDPPTARWSVSPTAVNFPSTITGEMREMVVQVTNTGIINLGLDVQLSNTDPEFTLVEGEGLLVLEPSLAHQVRIRFQPNSPGQFAGVLDLGAPIPPVNITGNGLAPVDSCEVSVPDLNFGNALVSVPVTRSVVVRNRGNQPLVLAPVSDSSHFSVSVSPFTLQPGSSRTLSVTFLAADLGPYEGHISLGSDFCSEITCRGSVILPLDPGPDGVGIFFDESWSVNEAYPTVSTPFPAYVVLFNPSASSPIAGWDCRIEIAGQVFILAQTYPTNAINVGSGPDYLVGYATPLPWAPAVKLLTFQLLTISSSEAINFSLGPVATPSVPGQMSWSTETYNSFVRMNTTTGVPVVATIYAAAPVGIAAPSPLLSRQDGQVHLTWPAPLRPGSSCHVYRRAATRLEERLTDQPLDAGVGNLEFTDNPAGFDAGTTLFYSYSVVVDGVEEARSPEVEYTFDAPRILASRLLPNVPNPFNPSTRIRFELARESEVQVSVFDVTGRLVKVLENSSLAAGEYSRTWQGRDESGRPVASGAYYVRLVMDNMVDHQKIMLLK